MAASLDPDDFKNGAMEIWHYENHGTFDDTRLEKLEKAIEQLRALCDRPSAYIREGFHHLYPAMDLTEQNLNKELDEELALIARVRNRDQLSKPEFERSKAFCGEMWSQLRMFQNFILPMPRDTRDA